MMIFRQFLDEMEIKEELINCVPNIEDEIHKR